MLLRVAVFCVLAFVFTFLLGGIQGALSLSQEAAIVPQLGPGLAALSMLLVFRKDRHRFSIAERKVPVMRYALAALVPVGGALVAFLISNLMFDMPGFGRVAEAPWILVLWMPLGAFGEELGWRGYMHKRLDIRLNGLASSIVTGALWAFWHIGMYANGAVYMAFFVLLMISYSFVIYSLVADTGFNVLAATIFHLAINVTNLFSYSVINEVGFIAVNSLVWAAIAVVVVLTRKSLFVAERTAQQEVQQ